MVITHRVAFVILTFFLTACASSTAAPVPTAIDEFTPVATPSSTRILVPIPSPSRPPAASPLPTHPIFSTPTAGVASTPVSSTYTPQIIVLAEHLREPDDLVLAPDGSIYFSDVGEGTINQLTRAGAVHPVLARLGEPEGMVFLPDGSLVFAEQTNNRLLHYNFQTKQLDIVVQLENATNQLGIDNIAYDVRRQQIIVPDSPNGTILFIDAAGKIVDKLATRLVRPTAVALAPDGSLLVADEFGNKLVRVNPTTGASATIASLPQPDDVVVNAQGEVCANTLVDGAVHCLNSETGQTDWVVRGFSEPQGLILDTDGNLVVTDPGHHRIVKIIH